MEDIARRLVKAAENGVADGAVIERSWGDGDYELVGLRSAMARAAAAALLRALATEGAFPDGHDLADEIEGDEDDL